MDEGRNEVNDDRWRKEEGDEARTVNIEGGWAGERRAGNEEEGE